MGRPYASARISLAKTALREPSRPYLRRVARRTYPLLVLVDLDLIVRVPDGVALRQKALSGALEKLLGFPLNVVVDVDQTDYSALCAALDRFGLGADEEGHQCFQYETFKAAEAAVLGHYLERLPESLEAAVLPGITRLIIECQASEAALIAPLANHCESVTKLMLQRARLDDTVFVACGGCSTYRRVRPDLVEMARNRAGSPGVPWPAERTVVVTSVAYDVTAAVAAGARSILVGDPLQLPVAAVGADHLVPELHDATPHVLRWAAEYR